MQSKVFVNFSEEAFVGVYGGVEYPFQSGESMMLQDYLADHFAKHLVDRELQKQGKLVNDSSRPELLKKCFGERTLSEVSEEKLEAELLNEKVEIKKKAGRPKKVEEEFPELRK